MSCEDIPSLLDLQNTKKHVDDFGRLMGTGEGTSTNGVTGQVRPTYNKVIKDLGFKPGSGDFTTGFTVMPGEFDVAWYNPVDKNWYSYLGVIPSPSGHPVAPGTNPVGSVDWAPRTDAVLRPSVIESLRRSYAVAGYDLIGTFSNTGIVVDSTTDVVLWELTGIAYAYSGTLPHTVGAGETPIGNPLWVAKQNESMRSSLFVDNFAAALITTFPSSIKTMTIVKYHASFAAESHLSNATNIMRRTTETGTPGSTDGGSWFCDASGVKWVSCLPFHVDRFGAYPGTSGSIPDSGPAFQKAAESAGKNLFGESKIIGMGGPVYKINSKVLWPSNVTFKGDQTTILSDSSDYIFESAYFKAGVLTSNWGLTDNDVIANALVTSSRFLNCQFNTVQKAFKLKGFTLMCAIGDEDVLFHNCGTAIFAELSFYSAFKAFIRGYHPAFSNQYAMALGHQCNLNRIKTTFSDRLLAVSLSEPTSVVRPNANMQMPDFTGSSFEGISGAAVTALGTTYGVNLDGVYSEATPLFLAKGTGAFKTYDMSINNKSWGYGVDKLLSMAGMVNFKCTLSNQNGTLPAIEFVSVDGMRNSGEIIIKGDFGLSYPNFTMDRHDDIKLSFSYARRGADVIYTSPEAYVTLPNIGTSAFEYELRAFDASKSINKAGTGSLHGTSGFGGANAYVTQNPDGTMLLHFTGLDAATYPWFAASEKVVVVRSI